MMRTFIRSVLFTTFVIIFPNTKTFLWVCQCVHQGGDCKIKGVFDYYSVMNNWHQRLLVLLFGIYFRSGFRDDWNLQVIYRYCYLLDWSDWAVVAGQTGVYHAVRPA